MKFVHHCFQRFLFVWGLFRVRLGFFRVCLGFVCFVVFLDVWVGRAVIYVWVDVLAWKSGSMLV